MQNSTTGALIKQRRKELGISADVLASKIGVSRATMYRYENGDIEKVPVDVIAPLANALQTTPAKLMGWDETERALAASGWDIESIAEEMNVPVEQIMDVISTPNTNPDSCAFLDKVIRVATVLIGTSSPSQEQSELVEYLELLKSRPECRMLFSLAKDATKEDVEKAVAIIEALRRTEGR